MPGRGKRACSALVAAGALACGDPGDIEVPFAPRAVKREALPVLERVPARAFAKLDVVDASVGGDALVTGGVCPVRFSSSLGKPCALLDTDNGTCVPVRDRDDASVACTVSPLVLVPDVYDVDLALRHEFLPTLTVTGPLDAIDESRLSLHVITPNGTVLDADCNAESLRVQPGTAHLRLTRCSTRVDGDDAPNCDINLLAGFEGCFRTVRAGP